MSQSFKESSPQWAITNKSCHRNCSPWGISGNNKNIPLPGSPRNSGLIDLRLRSRLRWSSLAKFKNRCFSCLPKDPASLLPSLCHLLGPYGTWVWDPEPMSPYWVLAIILGVVILPQFIYKEVWVNYPGPDNPALKVWGAGKGMRTRQDCPGLTAGLCPPNLLCCPLHWELQLPIDSFLELVVKNHSQLEIDCCRNIYTMDIGKHYKIRAFWFCWFCFWKPVYQHTS